MSTSGEQPQDAPGGQVILDLDLCKACGICIALCPEQVYERDNLGYPVVAREDECTSCLLCELHCPDFAIEIRRRARKKPAAGKPETPEAIADAHHGTVRAALAAAPAAPGAECDTHGEED